MAQKCYVTDNGLPRAVATSDDLPSNAFVGHTCYVEGGDDAGLYVYDGTEYDAVVSSGDGGGSDSATGSVPVYATVSALPAAADQEAGDMAYVTSTKAIYFSDGTNWSKLRTELGLIAPTVADTDHYPANPTAGQVVWLTGTGLQVYNGTAWKAITVES